MRPHVLARVCALACLILFVCVVRAACVFARGLPSLRMVLVATFLLFLHIGSWLRATRGFVFASLRDFMFRTSVYKFNVPPRKTRRDLRLPTL